MNIYILRGILLSHLLPSSAQKGHGSIAPPIGYDVKV